ncbi:hypothetical protein ACSNOI_19185 [Actinomadura kijaniata]|uniref:hypothetical protein n=1 Tax=Actinomadura kijaniata TaxID=46161 RepID=UPI003F1937E9
MTIRARLVASARLPGAEGRHHPPDLEGRRVLLVDGDVLAVYDLEELFRGRAEPAAAFPFPWPGWTRGGHSVSPDGAFAVLSGQRSVRAVTAGGGTLWEHRHPCWDAEDGHPHADDAQVCPGTESGFCRITADGSAVWAHVPHGGDEAEGEEWLVLDAGTGTVLARAALDTVASGSEHLAHPDGLHMGLSVGEGEDRAPVFWGRWDGVELTVRLLDDGRYLADARADAFLTVAHEGDDIVLHRFPDGGGTARLPAGTVPPHAPGAHPYWDFGCGHVDADHVIASTAGCDRGLGPERHWLLDAATLIRRSDPVAYPGDVTGPPRPLGDGTWLTWNDGRLLRWEIDT